jgi:hypothetical protein
MENGDTGGGRRKSGTGEMEGIFGQNRVKLGGWKKSQRVV